MRTSKQDKYYLTTEGDSFFDRNFENKELPALRESKQDIFDKIKGAQIEYANVLEYGCSYGDLLFFLSDSEGKEACGVEASGKAVSFSNEKYGAATTVVQGTIADNEINKNEKYANYFDLVIVDDVFGWVSRETIFNSIASIDSVLKDGGHIFIRDFYPDKKVKNRNHHVKDSEVFNFKVPGSHCSVFLDSGTYEVVWQEVYYDKIGFSRNYKCDNPFNYRWVDAILKKSLGDYFSESKKL